MDLKNIIMQQHRRSYGPALDIAFSTDKSNVSRTGPNPVHSRASSGTFVNQNGRIVGKTRSSTSLNPARVSVGGVAVFEVPAGSVVGWLNGSVVVVMEDTDGDDQIGSQRHITGTLIHKSDTTITLLVTSKVGTTTLSSWSISYRGLRINHDPITGLCLGTLIESSKTNLVEMSESFDNTSVWTQIRLVSQPVANTDIAPDGSLTAEKFIPSTALDNHRVDDPTIGIVSGSSYTVSAFVKAAGYTGFGIHVGNAPAFSTTFSLTGAGSVTSTATGWTARIYPYKDGWYRCCATFTATTANRLYLFVGKTGTTFTYAGDAMSGIVVWGAQCELGRESSYIPNYQLGSVIRSTDIYNISGTTFSRMWNTSGGTFVFEGLLSSGLSTNQYILSSGGNRRWLYGNNPGANNTTEALVAFDGAATPIYFSNVRISTRFKIAISVEATTCSASLNGSTITTINHNGNLLNSVTLLEFIANSFGIATRVKYYNKNLPNTSLQALTTTVSETITYNGVPILYNGEGLLETS